MQFQSLSGEWQFRRAGTKEWLPATVPGGVHTDLLAAGRIPDPFVGDNEKRVQWVAEADWEYKTSFVVPPELLAEEQLWLVCDGLDTLATVTLNGKELGRAANMYRQWRWNVKPFLRTLDVSGEPCANELQVAFASPVCYISKKQAERALPGVSQAIPGGPYLRKAPCQFGWDWGPQLPPIGIWKDIRLEAFSGAHIQEVHLRQHHADGQVTVEVRVAVERWGKLPLAASVRIIAPDGQVHQGRAEYVTDDPATVNVLIARPHIWWPNGYGEQPLYTVVVALHRSDSPGEAALDERTCKIGLRTIELRQEEDQWGRSFEFVVNGVRIFAKGSNWIPADSFPTRITDEHLERPDPFCGGDAPEHAAGLGRRLV